jgi:hypothetical protein
MTITILEGYKRTSREGGQKNIELQGQIERMEKEHHELLKKLEESSVSLEKSNNKT